MTIPYNIDFGLRNAVLAELAADVVAAGGTVIGIAPTAGETWPNWVMFLNRLTAAVNALGASPQLPMYDNLDYSAFGTVVKALIVALHPIANPPPVVNAASFNLTLPASNAQPIGNLTSTPSGAGNFTIVSGNPPGYFLLSGSGQLMTGTQGTTITPATYTLGVTCSNANGVSGVTNIVVNAA